MKKLQTAGFILLFLVTLYLLASHIFDNAASGPALSSRQTGTQTGAFVQVADISLGKVEVHNFQRMGFTKGFIKFSPDSRNLAIGTENGELMLLNLKGQVLWRKNMGLGKLSALEFSPDNRYLYIGETSQQGYLLCINREDGREIWRQSSVGELGVNIQDKTYPGIIAVRSDANGMVYAVGQRYIRYADGRNEYRGRIYKFNAAGVRQAIFPVDHNLDAWVSWVSVDAGGSRAAFGTANWDEGSTNRYTDSMYCLDGALRQILWSTEIPPAPPYQNTTMRSSPEFAPSGRHVAGVASDGRCFLYDGQGHELWFRTISQPQKVGGVYINAVGNYVHLTEEHAAFTTGNTYNRANWQLPTPVEHPGSNSVFVFDLSGKLVSRYKLGGMVEQISGTEQTMAIAIGRNVRSRDVGVHGLYLLSLPDARLLDYAATTGPCVGSAISPDGRYAAGVEAPLQLDDGQVIGAYRLLLLQRN
ncbi:PQQ-binding-like beta-propeller repeat protein [Sporomusa termitida]|uniref:Pyrrolo-quinoline quinone repeat domain-containing protein n=1 Tax=Sporomusa termitida TaxID=2377 RepID=A0A517DP10_9FIRM|nr:PQQ-binding-like beta-propeller repeat protein [Sporomusa termitida]QDR79105.1 hypothetical protein SPTER_03640 [Sporomusa termitida]